MVLEQRAMEDQRGDGEVDDEAGDVDKRRHEWSRGAGGIEPEPLQQERQELASHRTEGHDPDQRRTDGERHQRPVHAIVV